MCDVIKLMNPLTTGLRKSKPKTVFPTEQSLDTFIGVQAMDYNDRYFNRIHKGFGQVRDALESYFD